MIKRGMILILENIGVVPATLCKKSLFAKSTMNSIFQIAHFYYKLKQCGLFNKKCASWVSFYALGHEMQHSLQLQYTTLHYTFY